MRPLASSTRKSRRTANVSRLTRSCSMPIHVSLSAAHLDEHLPVVVVAVWVGLVIPQ